MQGNDCLHTYYLILSTHVLQMGKFEDEKTSLPRAGQAGRTTNPHDWNSLSFSPRFNFVARYGSCHFVGSPPGLPGKENPTSGNRALVQP